MTLWKPLFEQVMADRIDVSHRGVRSPVVRTNLVYIHCGPPVPAPLAHVYTGWGLIIIPNYCVMQRMSILAALYNL